VNTQNENKPTHPIPQEAFDWYDEYAHGLISRREFFNRLSTLTVLGFTVSALAAALIPNYALAEQVSFNDPDIKAPLLIHLAELDQRVNATWPEYEKDLKANKSPFTMHMYPDVNHGFHNDSTGRYNEAAAELAWGRTIEFFKKFLAV
jgi:dienelactone hydrolase